MFWSFFFHPETRWVDHDFNRQRFHLWFYIFCSTLIGWNNAGGHTSYEKKRNHIKEQKLCISRIFRIRENGRDLILLFSLLFSVFTSNLPARRKRSHILLQKKLMHLAANGLSMNVNCELEITQLTLSFWNDLLSSEILLTLPAAFVALRCCSGGEK